MILPLKPPKKRKKSAKVQNPCDIRLYWLVDRDPYNGFFNNPYIMGSISSHVYHIHHQEPQSRRSNVKGSNRAHHRAHLRPVFSDHVEATSAPRLPQTSRWWRWDIRGTAPTPMYGVKWCENKYEPRKKKQLITFFWELCQPSTCTLLCERLLLEKTKGCWGCRCGDLSSCETPM